MYCSRQLAITSIAIVGKQLLDKHCHASRKQNPYEHCLLFVASFYKEMVPSCAELLAIYGIID